MFWRSGARVRDHASPPGASSTRQTRRSRTLVDPVSLFWFVGRTEVGPTSWMSACWHDRRKLRPECTDRIGNRELGHGNICRRGGRFYISPVRPCPTSVTADAWPPKQMIGMVVEVPTWRPRGELPVVYQSDNADRKQGARCSKRYACVWVRELEHEQRPWWEIDGWFAVAGAGMGRHRHRHPKFGWRASPASSHCRWGLPDFGHSQHNFCIKPYLPKKTEGTQVFVGSMNMGCISETARNRTHNLFRPKREPIQLGHSDGLSYVSRWNWWRSDWVITVEILFSNRNERKSFQMLALGVFVQRINVAVAVAVAVATLTNMYKNNANSTVLEFIKIS